MSFNHAADKPLYSIWQGMKQRCYNPNNRLYSLYGGRGITVCKEWRESYWQFEADMMPRPGGLSIDRINPNGNYEPGNCRWADRKEQARNTRTARFVTIEGKEYRAADLAEKLDLKTDTLVKRAEAGFTMRELEEGYRLYYCPTNVNHLATKANKERCKKIETCNRGHPYNEENTRYTKQGWRYCRICNALRTKKYLDKKRGK